MAKIFETSQDIAELAQGKFDETPLSDLGINLKILSTTKSKSILKVSRANATTQFLTNKDVILVIYEEAFDRLSDEFKNKLEGDIAKEMFRMRRKYDNYVDVMETAYLVIQQIEDEEKERKEAEKQRKAEERAAKKRNG